MSQTDGQNQEPVEDEEPVAPPQRTGPVVRPIYIVILLILVLGIGGFALTGPVCNTKEPGRDLKDLTQQEILEQALNRLKDFQTLVAFTGMAHVLAKPTPVDPSSSGVVINTVLAVKKNGDVSEVVTHHTARGVTAYKLRLPDGACGYVFSTDPIRLTSR
jgi:hypothetical protein